MTDQTQSAVEAMASSRYDKFHRYTQWHQLAAGVKKDKENRERVSLTAALAWLDKNGWQIVPKVATGEMHNAARDWSYHKYGKFIGRGASEGCYAAMLAAAPKFGDV